MEDWTGSTLVVVRDAFLFLAAFLACSVEMVEALTIVLAVGVTRGWRSTLIGVGAAAAALAAVVAALGPPSPPSRSTALRVVVGGLLLIFGLQWLRKAILRASGFKALHDEDAIFARELDAARRAGTELAGGHGLVLVHGGLQGRVPRRARGRVHRPHLRRQPAQRRAGRRSPRPPPSWSVAVVGLLVHAPLSRVPENTMKFAVGVMLTTFGMFWGAEGAGVAGRATTPRSSACWPSSCSGRSPWSACAVTPGPGLVAPVKGFLRFWYDFVVGDDWTIAAAWWWRWR